MSRRLKVSCAVAIAVTSALVYATPSGSNGRFASEPYCITGTCPNPVVINVEAPRTAAVASTASVAQAGSSAGTLPLASAALPKPSPLVILIAGLGIVGYIASRRIDHR